jgi:hypothetical protein
MLDPEQLTFAQWFWIVVLMFVVIMFACRCISLYYPDEPLTNEQVEAPAAAGQPAGAPVQGGTAVPTRSSRSGLR